MSGNEIEENEIPSYPSPIHPPLTGPPPPLLTNLSSLPPPLTPDEIPGLAEPALPPFWVEVQHVDIACRGATLAHPDLQPGGHVHINVGRHSDLGL